MTVAISDNLSNFLRCSCACGIFLLGAMSCTYDPGNEITLRQIEQIPVRATFSLDSMTEGDTIILYQTSDIRFSIGVDKGEVKGVGAYISERRLDSYVADGSVTARVYVGYGGFASGTYTLSIEVISTTATGSVADKLGLETSTMRKSWPLKIDIDPPPTPNLKFSSSDGFLKVTWDPYLKKNFTSYKVTYSVEDYLTHYFTTRTVQINDPVKSFWIDSSYVAGYQVQFEVSTNTLYSFSTGRGRYQHSPQLSLEYTAADCTVRLNWTKIKFERAFKSYTVTENNVPRAELLEASDTACTFKLNPVLGQDAQLGVVFTPQYEAYRPWEVKTAVSEPIPLSTLNVAKNAAILFTYNTTLKKLIAFDYNTRQFFLCDSDFSPTSIQYQISQVGSHPSIPGQGTYGYFMGVEEVVRFDLTTGEEARHAEPGVLSNTQILSASGTGNISMFGTLRWSSGARSNFTQVKNFSADEFIYFKSQTIYESSPPAYAVLSDNGEYAYFPWTSQLYRIGTSQLTLIGEVPASVADFRVDNNEELVTYVPSGSVMIYNTADLSLKRTISPPEPGFTFQFYDPVTNTVLFRKLFSYTKYIVHIDTGETKQIKSVDVSSYINGSIFVSEKSYKKLQ